ncbi:flagellar hook-length control protein FliK [Paludibacterium paludis]|uniref:Uncharacterized protein n=1 Tax=Paludibacterium paludis TaxID=1225769 RepID=A0A918U7S8_9NEIS|nr:flagellar hook-length control protein FliK [Paludibacterium paludis]GGY04525.1 hypothetical protein GCM10011289_03800 [Paludibacterium paludis]
MPDFLPDPLSLVPRGGPDGLAAPLRPEMLRDALERAGINPVRGDIWHVRLEGHHLGQHLLVSLRDVRFAFLLPPGVEQTFQPGETLALKVLEGFPNLLLGLMLAQSGRPGPLVLAGTPLPADLVMQSLLAFADAPALRILMDHITPLAPTPGQFHAMLKQMALNSGIGYEALLAAWRRGDVPRETLAAQPQMLLTEPRPESLALLRDPSRGKNRLIDADVLALVERLYPESSPLRVLIERQLEVVARQAVQFPLFGWGVPLMVRLEEYQGMDDGPAPVPPVWSIVLEWRDERAGRLRARFIARATGVAVQMSAEEEGTRHYLREHRAAYAERLAENGLQLAGWLVMDALRENPRPPVAPGLPAPHRGVAGLARDARSAGFTVHDSEALLTLLLRLDWRRMLSETLCLAAGLFVDWLRRA